MPSERALLRALRAAVVLLAPFGADAQIRVNPTGVNVNTNGATTVFLTFGGIGDFRPIDTSRPKEKSAAVRRASISAT